jgi:hypothetical protein
MEEVPLFATKGEKRPGGGRKSYEIAKIAGICQKSKLENQELQPQKDTKEHGGDPGARLGRE